MPQRRVDSGTAGGSARREHAKRMRGDPSRARQWEIGAHGEELVAASLANNAPEAALLHDRRQPGSRGNIDHIAISPSGVYVIDSKRYRGTIKVEKPLFGTAKLRIDGRDRTKLVHGLEKQVAAVSRVVHEATSDIPVYGCFCFVAPEGILSESGLPLLRTLSINGYPLYYPRRLCKVLRRSGHLSPVGIESLHSLIAKAFPPA